MQDAIDSLYDIAVTQGKSTSTLRLRQLADYCVQQLARRGLAGADTDVTISGGARPKQWDVAWKLGEKYRLAISLKSILRNLAGSVRNRIDELIGEVANIQMYSPEVVVGYIMVFDISRDEVSRKHGVTWCDLLTGRLRKLSGRKAPSWSVGMIEAFSIVKVDFSTGPALLTPEDEVACLFDHLTNEVKIRNPSVSERQ